ncbi:hypothetical protein M3J09_000598 [Ascochyta lentis]
MPPLGVHIVRWHASSKAYYCHDKADSMHYFGNCKSINGRRTMQSDLRKMETVLAERRTSTNGQVIGALPIRERNPRSVLRRPLPHAAGGIPSGPYSFQHIQVIPAIVPF